MIWTPHVTVAAVIEVRGKFLLVQERVAGASVYNQPAGHLEDGETLAEAVMRETLEETAWRIQVEAIVGIYQWRHPDTPDTFLRITFAGSCLHHEPERTLDTGIERALWLPADAIRQQADRLRSPMVMRSIDDYLAGASWPLSLLAQIE
ncbi:MAG: NUDIX hydrolase [Gammaproteobacteria bacterium]